MRLATALDGEIISADSRQVYRGMDIGSGKDLQEYTTPSGAIPHHLIDIADPAQTYSVYHYQRDFYRVFAEIRARGRLPIMSGGTGLYIEAVLRGYGIPEVPEDPALRARLMSRSKEELEHELAAVAPDLYAHTDRSSKKRIVRALEIAHHGARAPQPGRAGPPPDLEPLVLAVRLPRPVLHERIHRRLASRFEAGMIDEVRELMQSGLSTRRIEMLGLEYRYLARFLRGEMPYDEMVEVLEREIRRFAKRQMTWFRGMERRGTPIHWIDGADAEQALRIAFDHGLGRHR